MTIVSGLILAAVTGCKHYHMNNEDTQLDVIQPGEK